MVTFVRMKKILLITYNAVVISNSSLGLLEIILSLFPCLLSSFQEESIGQRDVISSMNRTLAILLCTSSATRAVLRDGQPVNDGAYEEHLVRLRFTVNHHRDTR